MRIFVLFLMILMSASLAKTKMDQLDPPSPHSAGCSNPDLTSNNSTSLIYQCIGENGIQTLSVYWKVNNGTSTYNHIDTHDNNGNYISEVTIPIELNGTLLECCFVPPMGDNDICCSVIVNIDVITRKTDPGSEPTTVPTKLPTSMYDLDTSSLSTATPYNIDVENVQQDDSEVISAVTAAFSVVVIALVILIISIVVFTVIHRRKGRGSNSEITEC